MSSDDLAAFPSDDLGPESVQSDAALRIVDIRSEAERLSAIGFIPGSIWMPEDAVRRDPDLLRRLASPDCPVVIGCQSGRRSRLLVDALNESGVTGLLNLKGGLLEWGAHGYPLCCTGETTQQAMSADEWKRQVRSCFLVETIETVDDLDEANVDPISTVAEVLEAFVSEWTVDGARTALDHLSEAARRQGHPMDHIAANVSRFYDLAESVDA